jgi:UDP-N-acetylglucosamine 3-dehydrogenase
MKPVRLAIIGCGTITRGEHIPAAVAHPGIELAALADVDVARTKLLVEKNQLQCKVVGDYREILDEVDAVLNALPNHLHASTTMECLNKGRHVLCEKPLAITSQEARACTELAERNKVILAVGMNRRFAASHHLLKLIIEDGLIGSVESYEFKYGGAFDWRSASGFYFDRAKAGGGALMDFGVHMLDSVLDWFGPVESFDYQDDDWGSGVEANLLLDLKHTRSYGNVRGHLQISRTFGLNNRLLVKGSVASAEISVHDPEVVVIHRVIRGAPVKQSFHLENAADKKSYWRQLDNFVTSINERSKPEVDGWQAIRTLELIENCYTHKRRIPEPWSAIPEARIPNAASEVKVSATKPAETKEVRA